MGALLPLALVLALAAPTRWVTDEAGVLSATQRMQLDARLEAYERSSGHQVIVYVARTTGGEPIEDWASRTFQAWKIGRQGLDDGAALFVFVGDRSARIEVGYGLEGVLTDAASSRILRERLIPKMQAGDAPNAISGAVDGMLSVIGGAATEPAQAPALPQVPPAVRWIAMAVVALLFIALAIWKPRLAFFLLMMFTGRRRGGGGGGLGGGGFSGGGGRSGGGGASGHW